jgi:hypothetical protein
MRSETCGTKYSWKSLQENKSNNATSQKATHDYAFVVVVSAKSAISNRKFPALEA